MQFDIEKVSPIEQKLVFNIPADDIKSRMDTAFAQLQGNVRMPGFRQGKAPRKLIERRFGARVRSEVTNNVINESFKKTASEMVTLWTHLVTIHLEEALVPQALQVRSLALRVPPDRSQNPAHPRSLAPQPTAHCCKS